MRWSSHLKMFIMIRKKIELNSWLKNYLVKKNRIFVLMVSTLRRLTLRLLGQRISRIDRSCPFPKTMNNLEQQLSFIIEIDKLKRSSGKPAFFESDRHENDAEHSWHLAMMAMILAEHATMRRSTCRRCLKCS